MKTWIFTCIIPNVPDDIEMKGAAPFVSWDKISERVKHLKLNTYLRSTQILDMPFRPLLDIGQLGAAMDLALMKERTPEDIKTLTRQAHEMDCYPPSQETEEEKT